jgi:para-nitrobenzyl esterase
MADAWARFVKTGDPNGGGLLAWPRYQATNEQALEFGRETRPISLPSAPRLDMIRDYYASRRRP